MAMMQELTFKSAIADDAKWSESIQIQPAGREHAQIIRSRLPISITVRREPWNEEDYAWGFLVERDRIPIGVIVGITEDGWLAIIAPATFFGFLQKKEGAKCFGSGN